MAELNQRFREGRPSEVLREAGVLVHCWDGYEEPSYPWLPNSLLPHAVGTASAADRLSASLVFRRLQGKAAQEAIPLLRDCQMGVVLRPEATLVLCAYAGDGATQSANCDPPGLSADCLPGCVHDAGWCDPMHPVSDGWCQCSIGWCKGDPVRPQPWRPQDLDTMLRQHEEHFSPPDVIYNEVVIGSQALVERLPRSIEAFYYVDSHYTPLTASIPPKKLTDAQALFAMTYDYGRRTDLPPPVVAFRRDSWDQPFAVPMA